MNEVDIVPIQVLKDRIEAKENVVSVVFENARGARGTVLEGLSERGKRQAEMTCTIDGCTETHIREQSDWHQSYACRTHSKGKSKGASPVSGSVKGDDGQTFQFLPLQDADDEDTRKMKEANNTFYQALKARREEEARIAKAEREAARRAKTEEERRERSLRMEAEKKEKLKAQLVKIRAYAEQHNIPVSDVTLRMAERAEE